MCRGPSTLVRMGACGQRSTGFGDCGNLGSVPGTFGCGVPDLNEYGPSGGSDGEAPGGFEAFGPLPGSLILLQQLSGGVCRLVISY